MVQGVNRGSRAAQTKAPNVRNVGTLVKPEIKRLCGSINAQKEARGYEVEIEQSVSRKGSIIKIHLAPRVELTDLRKLEIPGDARQQRAQWSAEWAVGQEISRKLVTFLRQHFPGRQISLASPSRDHPFSCVITIG